MEKNKKSSPEDKESTRNENKLKDKNVLPPKIFSSHSQKRMENERAKNDKSTKNDESKSPNKAKSKKSAENAVADENDEQNARKREHAERRRKAKAAHFEDDIMAELKREFPTTDSKPKRKVSFEEETEDEKDKNVAQKAATDDDQPKTRARSNAIKDGLYVEPEFPDMPSQNIVVEKGGPESGQNLLGQEGFVSNLLLEVISQEKVLPPKEAKSKPVSRQDLVERRSTIMNVASDIDSHFEKKGKSRSLTLITSKRKASKSKASVSRAHLEKPLESRMSVTTKSETLPPELQHLKSGWQPTEDVEEEKQVGFRQRRQSWVGTYVEGTDYWSKREVSVEQEEVPLKLDERGQTWYDLPVADEVQIEIPTQTKCTLSRAKFDAVKMQPPEETEETADEEKKRLFSFDDRKPIPEKISSDLYQMFLELCKSDDLSAVQNRLSLLNSDKSLEKVGLLDHKKLTMIHTGFCFKAVGGDRYRGLTFPQYQMFIEMLAETRRMPVFDFVNRLKLGFSGIRLHEGDKT